MKLLITLLLGVFLSANVAFAKTKWVALSKTVASAATAEPISASKLLVQQFVIQAKSTNTLPISIGDSSSQVLTLTAGQSTSLNSQGFQGSAQLLDLNQVYVDVGLNGEGVNVLYAVEVSN